jgi:hypothetical protein
VPLDTTHDELTRSERSMSRAARRALDLDDELCTLVHVTDAQAHTDILIENGIERLQERVENGSARTEQAAVVRRSHLMLARIDKIKRRIAANLSEVA